MSAPSQNWILTALPIAALALATMIGTASVRAQGSSEAHPAHIHVGTCTELGDVVAPLTDVAVPATEMTGPASATPVAISDTVVPLTIEDIVAGGHAINIHESAENIGNYIACGDVGGAVVDGRLLVGLGPLNDSGYSGVAELVAGDEGTNVSVFLTERDDAEASGTQGSPASDDATDDDQAAAVESATVAIVNFSFDPAEITIPAGGTITWTNEDGVPHTATAQDRDILQSGTIDAGSTYEQTFESPGTYDYFCEFHANMKGTIVVE